ncbi:MAG TPA: cation diffusion facilitator family transporter, partial [Fibrobacteraceae bacterium]|nr:cation diffusion facilitator family transporter [Fibrobacteraceae bacterium]
MKFFLIECNQRLDLAPNLHHQEQRTTWVILLTSTMMVGEIIGGWSFQSMALLSDGIHMGTHAFALLVSLGAMVVARRHRDNANFSFGTGRVGVLAGYTSALFLMLAALFMLQES